MKTNASVYGLLLALGLGLAPLGGAAAIVVPGPQSNSEGNYNNSFPFVISLDNLFSQRYQQVYSSADFAGLGPIIVTAIDFRPDAVFGSPFAFTLASVRIALSTTAVAPNALSTVFADNAAPDPTTVFPTGPLVLSSSYTGPPDGPKDFDIHIGFATPFLYEPSQGNLLLDVWNNGGGPDPGGMNAAFEDQHADGDSVSRVYTLASFGIDSSSGVVDSAGLVTQFEFETASVPEPATGAITLAILAGLLFRKRLRAAARARLERIGLLVLAVSSTAPACMAQPAFFVRAVNSASYSDSIAQGSIFTIFGAQLGPAELQQANSYPLPLEIAGTAISVTAGGRTLNCPMIYSSRYQAAAILPSETPLGEAQLSVKYSGVSGFGRITVVAAAFGLYTTTNSGIGPGTITGTDYVVKSFDHPARPGEVLILWGTGLGPIDGSDANVPVIGKQFPDTEVFIGNLPAKVAYAGRSGCCAGLDQIVVEVPDSPAGCFVPVVVRSGGLVSNFTTVAIEPSEGACSSGSTGVPASILFKALAGQPLRYAEIALGPIRVLQTAGFSFSQALADRLSAVLRRPVAESDLRRLIAAYRAKKRHTAAEILAKYGINPKHIDPRVLRLLRPAVAMDQQGAGAAFGILRNLSAFSPLFAAHFTAVGTCTVTQGLPNAAVPRSTGLNAGASLTLDGPEGKRVLKPVSNGQYLLSMGGGFDNGVLPTGVYALTGAGGSDIGAFHASIAIGNTLTWTNKSSIGVVDRSRPLTVTWSGGAVPGNVLIAGGSHTDGRSTAFICVEDSRKGMFTIPSFVLSVLPPANASNGVLFLAPHPFSNPVSIPGVDVAYIADAGSDYKSLEVR